MALLDLDPDQLLTTTRAVRKRLDYDRTVDPALVRECLEVALQAPAGSNDQTWQWVVVADEEKKRAIADVYRKAFAVYETMPFSAGGLAEGKPPERAAVQHRVQDSAAHLAANLHRAPFLVIPCKEGRFEGMPAMVQASVWGSICPAIWSFMLAARARGLGTAWTSLHLMHEEEVAGILGIPFESVTQACLTPVAHTLGTDFKPAPREPLDDHLHWDGWGGRA